MKYTTNDRLPLLLLLLSMALGLTGCPRTPAHAQGDATTAVASRAGHASRPAAEKPAPRMSDPLPAQVMPEPVHLDYSCRADSDCAIKDVGSCCGARPACVNKDSAADPAAVRAACAKQGVRGSCASGSFKRCGCHQGRCAPADRAPVGGWLDDPPPPPDPIR